MPPTASETRPSDPSAPSGPSASGASGASAVEAAAELAAAVRDDAARWDEQGALPDEAVRAVAAAGLLGLDLPARHGGAGATPAQLGEAVAHLGGVCGALRALLTVQGMTAAALLRWGGQEQRARWLPALASGERLAGFAATEREAGSALAEVGTRIEDDGERLVVTGAKRWVTFGQSADVFLVLGRTDAGPTAVLVEADRPGIVREPVSGQLGLRAARIAHLTFDRVRVPRENLVAPPGLGLTHTAAVALDHGRFTVAWGCVGMAEACLADAAEHAAGRVQGGVPLAGHQLVRSLLARSAVDTAAARALAERAAEARAGSPLGAATETVVAKYAAAGAAKAVADRAVQILGSAGCEPGVRAGRFYRDAKVMEIIEGSPQVAELHIADRLLRQGVRR
ncbi:acyl-CoA dehydrogenase family protein [Kitasatospora sp. NBC_01300]|uniref:acyl-CoA dehydrogenase family protein n=1 Tax=Kitasatospora sp. NBC_01300 TaxID=2903574 RepID=UPI00352D3A63|nr:acyl-CoA dehydrogenase family protein [Kitasatospora sp. NBC_01300]